MKAPRFAYARPASLAEALALLAEHKDDARVLAGGQSLVPMMNFRVAAPKVLVAINRIGSLTGIKVTRSFVRIGALTRHVELERSADIAEHLPLVMAREGSDADETPGDLDAGQGPDAVDVDEDFGRGDAEIHHRHKALAAREHPRVVPVLVEQGERFGNARRPRVGKARCFHPSSSVVL